MYDVTKMIKLAARFGFARSTTHVRSLWLDTNNPEAAIQFINESGAGNRRTFRNDNHDLIVGHRKVFNPGIRFAGTKTASRKENYCLLLCTSHVQESKPVTDLNKRVDALEKTLELLSAQTSVAALAARQILETVQLAHQTYYGTGFQNLAGYIFTGLRAAGLGATESLDFDAALNRATGLASALKEGRDPISNATGDLGMAYRSTFDGKLVPYRVYLPSNYEKGKKYPLLVLLHGAGGDETNFLDSYAKLWPKLAEERGYILASVNGRGPLSGYRKETGGEQDVLDVLDLMKTHYSIDAARVYLGGHSMGGGGTWMIGLTHADRFAGLIPIAGSSSAVLPGLETLAKSGRKLPVMMVCGVKDALVAVAGCRAVAEKAKTLDLPVKYAEYADGDHLSVAVMSIPDIFAWLDLQGRSSVSAK